MEKYKKFILPVLIALIVIWGGNAAYKYFAGPKIKESTLTKSIDENGKPTAPADTFTSKDNIYFSAKGKKLSIKEATVIWYKGEILTENRFKVDEKIKKSKSGYFSSQLSVPEGLEEGTYGVTIYNAGRDIIEAQWRFEIKN